MAAKMKTGVPQANGTMAAEPMMDVECVARATGNEQDWGKETLDSGQYHVVANKPDATQVSDTDFARPPAGQPDLRHLVDTTVERHGRVDVVVANAGISTTIPALRETVGRFAEVVGVGRDVRQQFRGPDARHAGGDGLEVATDLHRRIRLGVQGVHLAGSAVKVQHNHRFGLSNG